MKLRAGRARVKRNGGAAAACVAYLMFANLGMILGMFRLRCQVTPDILGHICDGVARAIGPLPYAAHRGPADSAVLVHRTYSVFIAYSESSIKLPSGVSVRRRI